MPHATLLEFFEGFARHRDVFVVHDDGYRVRQLTYDEVVRASRAFAARLHDAGVRQGDRVIVWGENSGEWIVALWGCLLAGGVLVPVDYRASAELLARIAGIVQARVVLVGAEVELTTPVAAPVWPLRDVVTEATPPAGVAVRPGAPQISGDTLAEIIFTSGATADPKGVTLTHRNILANILPIEREIARYRWLERPFHPVRFLNLLPLSHMFGQSMATFVPPLLGATVVFSHGFSPAEIVRQVRSRRVSVLVCVPKVLDVLRTHVERLHPQSAEADALAGRHWLTRWWRYREVHRAFGWKFWAIVCGAAPLPPELEAFWRKLGFLVIQGYGLTETAPVVTLNHPFRSSQGSVGTAIAGVEIRIADDGEILVRGPNVTAGYYVPAGTPPPEAAEAFAGGWFHTGDIGEMDDAGRLRIKGRKKEMIVTPQGLNVFPEDVERALLAQPGVRDAAVVGIAVEGEERIHAVLVIEPGQDVSRIVADANATLEDHQRVWSASTWPGQALPRTEGTQKLKRREIQRWASGERSAAGTTAAQGRSIPAIVARFAGGRPLGPETTLESLGLSSLDRVELMMALEEAFQTTLDESAISAATTIRQLEALTSDTAAGVDLGAAPQPHAMDARRAVRSDVRPSTAATAPHDGAAIVFPSWNRTWLAHVVRTVSLETWILPLARVFMRLSVAGIEHVRDLRTPVLFAANHQSHFDAPAIFAALPRRVRHRLAPAMAKEFFRAHFNRSQVSRSEWLKNSLYYYLACEFFNAFPLPQRETGTRQTLRYIGEVMTDGYSVLIFPEGKRTVAGEINRFMPGVGMIAAKLDVPVVPVRLEGLDRILHARMKFPRRGPARVAFGPPLRLDGDDYAALADKVEHAVRNLEPSPPAGEP